jgi:tRNA (guanine-N7-)-methyltransferase
MGRIRKIKDAEHLILQFKQIIGEPNIKYFNNNNPLHLEVGCGKGDFIIQKALSNKDINFIAIEKEPTIVYKLLKKVNNLLEIPINLKVLCIDANDLLT